MLDAANRDQQTAANHYASWEEGLRGDSPYSPPPAVWSTLAASGRVYYLGHFADDNAWSNYVLCGDSGNPSSILIEGVASQPGDSGGGSGGGGEAAAVEVRYPSGTLFQSVARPQDGVDYSDPVANGMIPLIDTRGRESENLSANFKLNELMARGARYARIAPQLVETLQAIRTHLAQPLKVASGYRHPALNDALGGDDQSEHMSGRAAAVSGTSAAVPPIDIARAGDSKGSPTTLASASGPRVCTSMWPVCFRPSSMTALR